MPFPFSLVNAPSTFQALMNDVFQPFLQEFVLVFFDVFLIYSQTWAENSQHLRLIFSPLKDHCRFLKKPKCLFAQPQVSYLGNIISVVADDSKISTILQWPKLNTVLGLRGFF